MGQTTMIDGDAVYQDTVLVARIERTPNGEWGLLLLEDAPEALEKLRDATWTYFIEATLDVIDALPARVEMRC